MSKLPKEFQFMDFSDYGRSGGRIIAKVFVNTRFTPLHVTTLFVISGLLAIVCILNEYYVSAALLIILKSVLDAADGELSRLKNTPSYTGRYYDSIADIILNFLFLLSFWYVTDESILYMLIAFFSIQLQGTLYNFYYVILRNRVDGDATSRIFETKVPKALPGEKQSTVNFVFKLYTIFYSGFDKIIYAIEKDAVKCKPFPKWFMSLVSLFGLGFQLLTMSILLLLDLQEMVIPFFISYSILILVFITIRKTLLSKS